ncbi:MAG: 6,7-dimethyl-8-ribityllumazine synthase [Candidatus Korarchaeum sp.]|nr:6,7-dimethyl-8-ribityllumazine synthase [Candidatus Korarchaeum sp.]MDW8035296.1 6,7-dimethyl-8-ribityllumazine synthase [Candidatus Korarchaeum sp.]
MRYRIGVVIAEMNPQFSGRMLSSLIDKAANYDVDVVKICRVPGLLESPLVTSELLKRNDIDAVILLGSIVKETSLEDYIFNQVVSKLTDLSLSSGKPVTFGISGPGIYWSDKLASLGAEEYAELALKAAVRTLDTLKDLKS